jgi:hypothetical protein
MAVKLPNFFLIGCQKAATTWLYRCFKEHPEIYVPRNDEIHFFDIHYFRGLAWYEQFYKDYNGEKMIGDTTSSYIRDPLVPKRIADYKLDAKLLVSLRNPIERAFSHYWHEKKKRKIAFAFNEVFENYDLFQNWIIPGFYRQHLENYYKYFSKEQILVVIFEDIARNARGFLQQVFGFLDVDANFAPTVLEVKINEAWYQRTTGEKVKHFIGLLYEKVISKFMFPQSKDRYVGEMDLSRGASEYEEGMDAFIRDRLQEIFRKENERLGELVNRDLSFWN